MEKYIELIIAVLSGLITTIPLVYQLVVYVKKSVKEKNWKQLLSLLISLMQTAETKFNNGVTRKEWVLAMISTSAEFLNCNISIEDVSRMIDSLCDMTNVINVNKEVKEESKEIIE